MNAASHESKLDVQETDKRSPRSNISRRFELHFNPAEMKIGHDARPTLRKGLPFPQVRNAETEHGYILCSHRRRDKAKEKGSPTAVARDARVHHEKHLLQRRDKRPYLCSFHSRPNCMYVPLTRLPIMAETAQLYQSGEVDGTRGGRRALRGNQRRARAREEAKAKAAAGASSSSLSGAPAPVEAEDNDTEWEMVNRTPASAYGFKTPPSNTALSADLPVSGSSVNSTSTRPTREGNSGFPASADADAGAGGRGNVPSSSSLRRSSGGGRSPEMSGAVATIPAPAARVAPITNGVSTGESSRTKSGKPAELLSEALTAVHREQRHQRRTLENRGDDERVGVAERSAAETQAAPGFERAPAAAATTATTATSASDASPHDDRIRGAEAKKMKEVIASATPTTAASGTASTDLDDSGRRGSGARATGYGAWRRRWGRCLASK